MKKYYSTLLIVDDDPNELMLIENAFREIGVTDPIRTAQGGREAIAYMMGEGKYEVPEVDSTGRQLLTDSKDKLGERFAQP